MPVGKHGTKEVKISLSIILLEYDDSPPGSERSGGAKTVAFTALHLAADSALK